MSEGKRDGTELLEAARELAAAVRARVRAGMRAALDAGRLDAVARPVGRGVGDFTYGIDVGAEEEVARWHARLSRAGPVSLLSEDAGWRHLGPEGELAPFAHGGPRIAIDPIDGTRNLMADLRPAWVSIAACAPGAGEPRLEDVELGLLSELPVSNARSWRELDARAGSGARLIERDLDDGRVLRTRALDAGDDDRVDHGYLCFFRYTPAARPALATIEADVLARLERHEGADLRHVYDDQYISNAGQLALLSCGTYRLIADLRAWAADALGLPGVTSKPYDVAAAIRVAREAGCVVEPPEGGAFPQALDAHQPVSFVGYANEPTAARVRPHLLDALDAARRRGRR